MSHAARQLPSWLIFDVGRKMASTASLRIAACAILLVAVGTAWKDRRFLTVDLPIADDYPWKAVHCVRHGGATPTMLPGFADTRLSGQEIMRMAAKLAQERRIDLALYAPPIISLQDNRGVLEWTITWSRYGSRIVVTISDKTGAAKLEDIASTPIRTTVSKLMAFPDLFNGLRVDVDCEIREGFEHAAIEDPESKDHVHIAHRYAMEKSQFERLRGSFKQVGNLGAYPTYGVSARIVGVFRYKKLMEEGFGPWGLAPGEITIEQVVEMKSL